MQYMINRKRYHKTIIKGIYNYGKRKSKKDSRIS